MPNIPNKQLHSTVPCRRCRHKLASMPRWLSSAKVRPVTHTFNRFRHLMALTMRDRQVETVRKLLAEDPVRPFPLARILHGPLQLFVPSRDVWHRVSHPGDAVRCTCFEPSLGNTPPHAFGQQSADTDKTTCSTIAFHFSLFALVFITRTLLGLLGRRALPQVARIAGD